MNIDILKKHFKRMPTLNTEHLMLRKLKTCDTDDMYEYARLPQVTQYLTWIEHPNKAYTHRYLEFIKDQYADGDFYDWALILKDREKMIGTCGFTSFDVQNNSAEIGYVVNPEYQSNGYATEAVREVMRFGFMNLNLHRITARFIDGNTASLAVMKKCGMRYEGCAKSSMYIKGVYRDIHTCAILSSEYIEFTRKSKGNLSFS